MGLRRVVLLGLCAGLFTLSAPRDAHATYIKIAEIMTGTHLDPNVQYVVLRFEAAGGNTDGYILYQYDNSNPSVGMGTTTLAGNLSNSQKGGTILLATPAAEQFFHVNADAYLTGQPLPAQGALCLVAPGKDLTAYDDCVVWGGGVFPAQHGTASVDAFNPSGGIQVGMVVQRITNSSTPTHCWSSRDFWTGVRPWPQNNVGMLGSSPPSLCGNNAVEGLEECDKGSSNGAGNACTIDCKLNPGANCPSGVVDPGEQCDDKNTVNHDGCSATCRWESQYWANPAMSMVAVCGNHILESGEACDPPGANCSGQCQLKSSVVLPFCGDGAVESPANPNFADANDPNAQEQCDPGDTTFACTMTCRWPANHTIATCSNHMVELGEQCDDGNLSDHDGCDHLCQFETLLTQVGDANIKPAWSCGDGFLSPGEACDHGASNGVGNDACKSDCTLVNPPSFTSNAAGGTNTAGTVTGATNTGGTVTGATNTGGTTTAGTNTGGTNTAGTNTGGTTTAGTNTAGTVTGATTTAGTTTAGTNTGGTTTAGTTTAGTDTGGTVTGATTTAGTTTAGTNTGGTVTGATTTAGTVTGATTTAGTVTGATTTAGTVTGATTTAGTVTGGSNTGGTVTGATTTAGTTSGGNGGGTPTSSSSSSSSTGGAATGDSPAGDTTGTTTNGSTTNAVSIDGSANTTGGPKDVKGVSCRNLDTEGAAWLVLVFGALSVLHRAGPRLARARSRR